MKRIVEETYEDGKTIYSVESNRFLFFPCKWRTVNVYSDINKAYASIGILYENIQNRTKEHTLIYRRVIW